jgi:glycine C-acetyltransferase
MSKQQFFQTLQSELNRIDEAKITKRLEKIIDGFTDELSPKALIAGKKYSIFNSNDYLGLRHSSRMKRAEHETSQKFGTGPGAVRFISGSLSVYRELEKSIANFHGRDDAMIFSSAFATNLAVMSALSQGLSKDSLIDNNVLIVSDSLNHRSIIDGVRLTGLPKENRQIFKHKDMADFERLLVENIEKFGRVIVVTDGVFSMLGEYQDLLPMSKIIEKYDSKYKNGIVLVVDDAHGVGIVGETGRGTEELQNVRVDVLIGTFGKAFGADGGYVVASQGVIDYLRESSATYIYSNPISPGTAGGALEAIRCLNSQEGKKLLAMSKSNTAIFKELMAKYSLQFVTESTHPIQPVLVGDTAKTKLLTNALFEKGFLVTGISYPVVSKGSDEIRVQISATHDRGEIEQLVESLRDSLIPAI